MPKVKINNFNLYYEVYGEGHPLLMILGLGANTSWWGRYFLKELAKHFKVIVFDNRGTGQSDDPKLDYTIKTLADDTIGLMDALNVEYAHLFGHSMGGGIAQELVLNYDRVNKLILCSTSCGGSKSILASPEVLQIVDKPREGRTIEEIAKETLTIFYSNKFIKKNPKLIEYAIQNMGKTPMSPENYERQTKAIESFNTCDKLKELKMSTLIMHGKKDILVPPQNAEILAELITNSQITWFNKSAHAPFVEEPNMVLKAIIEFLK